MFKYKINKYQELYAFLWDGKDETIDLINDYFKEIDRDDMRAMRCHSNNDMLGIVTTHDEFSHGESFFRMNRYLVDIGNDIFSEYNDESLLERNIKLEKVSNTVEPTDEEVEYDLDCSFYEHYFVEEILSGGSETYVIFRWDESQNKIYVTRKVRNTEDNKVETIPMIFNYRENALEHITKLHESNDK